MGQGVHGLLFQLAQPLEHASEILSFTPNGCCFFIYIRRDTVSLCVFGVAKHGLLLAGTWWRGLFRHATAGTVQSVILCARRDLAHSWFETHEF